MTRWDAARHKRASHDATNLSVERLTWRCLECRGQLPAGRIGYCSDACSKTSRAKIRSGRLKEAT